MAKTRKIKKTHPDIEHHHLLLRLETTRCPGPEDKAEAETLIRNIVKDIHMKLLAKPHVYYAKVPKYNEGLTAIAPIETSHIAFHFWTKPDNQILLNTSSRCLLQFDVYTCGTLSMKQAKSILHHLTHYGPHHMNLTILNRNRGLSTEASFLWDSAKDQPWPHWLETHLV
jgi:S-adenosylmethionine/arginine decarboxylase-like enzyme